MKIIIELELEPEVEKDYLKLSEGDRKSEVAEAISYGLIVCSSCVFDGGDIKATTIKEI